MYRLWGRLARLASHHVTAIEVVSVFLFAFIASSSPVHALPRLLDRSLFMHSTLPGATTDWDVSFTYQAAPEVGSVDMQFCVDPIPYMPCAIPTGLDVSQAVLDSQLGEAGFTISVRTANHIVLTRTPGPAGPTPSKYSFKNIKNPTDKSQAFSIRLANYASTDATGTIINLGSVRGQVSDGVGFETQVPPILIFCMAEQVTASCDSVSENQYTDMGTLSSKDTLSALSQMGIGTNASGGYVITVNGTTMQAGTNVIKALDAPSPSMPGQQQFGINLRANNAPQVGIEPDGASENATPAPNYNIPDRFMFKDGDIVAGAPNVSLIRRFTTSYIVNAPDNLKAGVYTTTLTYICSGRF